MDFIKQAVTQFLTDLGRIASALETIAVSFMGDETPDGSAPAAPGAAPAAEGGKRKRRTKAEMAADTTGAGAAAANAAITGVLGTQLQQPPAMPGFPAAGAAPFTPPGMPAVPPAAAPGMPTVQGGVAPAPTAPAFAPTAAFAAAQQPGLTAAIAPQATVQPPVSAPPPVQQQPTAHDTASVAAQYAMLSVEQQFAALLDLFSKYGNHVPVRDAMAKATSDVQCPMPLSDPLDRSKPGAGYVALSNEARWHIYAALFSTASALAAQA